MELSGVKADSGSGLCGQRDEEEKAAGVPSGAAEENQ